MTTRQQNNNGRVTMAVLATKLDAIAETVHDIKAGQEKQDTRIGDLEKADVKLNERLSTWRAVQTVVSAALAAIAGYVGTRN